MSYGTVNADVMQSSVAGVSLGAGNASIMKNRIINGSMVIDQRNAGASVTITSNGQYNLDRWQAVSSVSSKMSVQQNAGAINPPEGFTKYLGATSLSAYTVGTNEAFCIAQAIEGFNVADLDFGKSTAKTVTLSAWVYSSLTGTFGGALSNALQNRSYAFTYSIPVANTWTKISVTIAGDTSGTWATDNTLGLWVFFGLGVGTGLSGSAGSWAGSAYLSATGATSVVGTNTAKFYITGVQLEVGASATGFEYRQYGTELALCQRYYAKSYDIGTAPANVATNGQTRFQGTTDNGANVLVSIPLPVSMRTAPTVTPYNASTASANSWQYNISGSAGNSATTINNVGQSTLQIYCNLGVTWVAATINGHWTASAEL